MKQLQRIASIDIGTNTVLLLIADVNSEGQITTIHEEQRIIRLGKNVDTNRNIGIEGLMKCVGVLQAYRAIAEKYACVELTACGTSALRDAHNRDWFLEEVKKQSGVQIEILSGDDEALWTYHGGCLVLPKTQIDDQDTLVIDIGGGSTEFIVGNKTEIMHKISLDIGAVRLTEMFIKNDPIKPQEELSLQQFVASVLTEKLEHYRLSKNIRCIGVAGTITTLAAMEQKMGQYQPDKINGYVLSKGILDKMIIDLRPMTIPDRKNIKGLQPERADVIFAGAVILKEALAYFQLQEVLVSNYGLRYGLILRKIKNPLV
ncbi:Ppx/GppA family phosphatase [bacterium]|nr:Ppx/GppA family phosphatase [bacterium]